MTTSCSLADLEAAINYWRAQSPSRGEELVLCPEASALAEPYALMIFEGRREIGTEAMKPDARAAMADWRARGGGSPTPHSADASAGTPATPAAPRG